MGCGPGSREHPHSVAAPSQPSFACRGLLFGRVVVRCNQPHPWFGCTTPSSPPAASEQPCGVWQRSHPPRPRDSRELRDGAAIAAHPDLRSAGRQQCKYILDVCCFDFERGYGDE